MKVKKLFLSLMALVAIMLTGCSISNTKKLTFVQTPQAIYYAVGSDEALAAQEEVLENVIVRVDGQQQYTLKDLKDYLGAEVLGLDLTKEGTHTLIVKYGGATLTYIYKVVTDLGATLFAGGKGTLDAPYKIATPQQFLNLFTRVYGIAAPEKDLTKYGAVKDNIESVTKAYNDRELAWKTYYQACFPFFTTGLYYELTADLDFSGKEFVTLGALGASNYLAFTGKINGNNHTIKNVNVTGVGDYAGLFAGLKEATIENLILDNITIEPVSETKFAAALTATALPQIIYGANPAETSINEIKNVHVTNSLIFGARAAAIVGRFSNTHLVGCSNDENTKIIGFNAQTGGLAAHIILTSKYSYSELNLSYGYIDYNLNGTIEDGAEKSVGSSTNNAIKNSENKATIIISLSSVDGHAPNTESPQIYGSVENPDLLTLKGNILDTTPTITYNEAPASFDSTLFMMRTTQDSNYEFIGGTERYVTFGNIDVTSVKSVKMYYYSKDHFATRHITEEVADKLNEEFFFDNDNKVLYLNNKFDNYDIDGNIITAYRVFSTVNEIYTIYKKDGRIIGVTSVKPEAKLYTIDQFIEDNPQL